MDRRRLAAILALGLVLAAVVLAIAAAVASFPNGISVLACVAIAIVAASYGVLRRGRARVLGVLVATVALLGAVVLVALEGQIVTNLAVLALGAASLVPAQEAFTLQMDLPRASVPHHPVLFFNPPSGGGKAKRFHLAEEARSRGIKPVELRRGDDLETLVRGAIADGADALAMAGGDGSQAIVAAVAAEQGLPYACIPAGTRNHFALDLGVDRDDVVGGLDAFVDGGERRVDLAEVDGRVFVNNVSLGVYAEAVERAEYRDAKLKTLLATVPDVLGPEAERSDLRWRGEGGREHRSAAAILVSNNRYRLGHAVASGTRPRIDEGVLGIAVVRAPPGTRESAGRRQPPLRQWTSPRFEVDASSPIAAGIDGEAAMLDPPLRFLIRPAALRVRISRRHPGASPSAGMPEGIGDAVASLLRIALGRRQGGTEQERRERRSDGHLRGRTKGDADAEGGRDATSPAGEHARDR
jgi:diacylglycerol kinase family enzyme